MNSKDGKTIRELSAVELEQIAGGCGCTTTTLPNGHVMKICNGTVYIDGHPAGPA